MNEEQLQYLAGYIDGDGCFCIYRTGSKFRTSITVSSSNPAILHYIHSFFSGSLQFRKDVPEGQKSWGQWVIQGLKAKEFATLIYPFLIQRKKECEMFLEFFRTINRIEKIDYMDVLRNYKTADLVNEGDLITLKNLHDTIPYTESDLIYLAGFVDAECCMTIQRDIVKDKPNPVFKIILRLNDTRSTIFYWLKSRFGGCISWMRKPRGYHPQLIWILRGKQAYDLIKKIVNFLRHKRPVALKLIEFFETTIPNGGARHTEAFRNAYSIILARREEIVSEVRKLNHKGL